MLNESPLFNTLLERIVTVSQLWTPNGETPLPGVQTSQGVGCHVVAGSSILSFSWILIIVSEAREWTFLSFLDRDSLFYAAILGLMAFMAFNNCTSLHFSCQGNYPMNDPRHADRYSRDTAVFKTVFRDGVHAHPLDVVPV